MERKERIKYLIIGMIVMAVFSTMITPVIADVI